MAKEKSRDTYQRNLLVYNAPWLLLRGLTGISFAFVNVALGQLSRQVYDDAILAGSRQMLWKLGAMYLLALSAFLLFQVLQEIVIIYIEERSAERLRCDTYAGYLRKPFAEMEKLRGGDFLTIMTSDINNMKPLGGTVWVDIVNSLMMLAVLLWWLFSVDGLLAAMLLPAPLFFCFAIIFFSTKMFNISNKLQEYRASTNSLISQVVAGSNTIRLFLLKAMVKQRFSKSVSDLAEKAVKLDVTNARMLSVWNLIMIPYQAVFFLVTGWIHIQKGSPTVGTILAFSNFISFLVYPLMSLLGSVADVGSMLASKQRVWRILSGSQGRQKVLAAQSATGDIVLRNINFSYDEGQNVLNDVSFTIPGKKTTVIWGCSGSGKSTLAKLLLDLYQPTGGSITFAGQGSDAGSAGFSKRISLLEQQPFIFEGTVKANVLLGQPDADEEQLRRAASNACIAERLEQLPKGYDTILDEKTPLSGGEKQRLALARCFVRDSDVFILDEPTSALNAELAHEVLRCLHKYYPETTKVIITHDPSILQYADWCVVIDKGHLIYTGPMDDTVSIHRFFGNPSTRQAGDKTYEQIAQ